MGKSFRRDIDGFDRKRRNAEKQFRQQRRRDDKWANSPLAAREFDPRMGYPQEFEGNDE